ncbi:MAG: putative alpha-E superfamily protein [Sulfitobacter sp.]|jgi:uncharacterized alpha-E superfamily protein
MLSRVAERMYWMGRYIERAENTTRLISVNTNLVMDMPKVKHIWQSLLLITGAEARFQQRFTKVDERNVIKFLLNDELNSVRACIGLARENARTTREILPNEAWVLINELDLFIKREQNQGIKRGGRHRFLQEITAICNQLTGILASSMSVDTAYNFIELGRKLERADMTTRIVDVGCLSLLNPETNDISEYDDILWMNVLKSLAGYQMYRQHVQDRVNGEDVVDFLIKNKNFPRAVAHCLANANESCKALPRNENTLREISQAQRHLDQNDVIKLLNESQLHEFIDEVQLDLANIHDEICKTWFMHDLSQAESAGSQKRLEFTD